jgi:hypothetical protein
MVLMTVAKFAGEPAFQLGQRLTWHELLLWYAEIRDVTGPAHE